MRTGLYASGLQISSGDERYCRDRGRYLLALRMLECEVRTSVIAEWTGLTHCRIRSLSKARAEKFSNNAKRRYRGKSPSNVRFFLRSPQMRLESAVVAGLCLGTGLVPEKAVPNLRGFANAKRGELLRRVFDLYCALSRDPERPLLSMEHVVVLVLALAKRDELTLGVCGECERLVVRDRLAMGKVRCEDCRSRAAVGRKTHQAQENTVPVSGIKNDDDFLQSDLFGFGGVSKAAQFKAPIP